MYNAEIPKDIELPSSRKLIKSTAIAAVSAVVVLVTCVMPAEYAIDPTGIGKVLGLTKMGEIKQSLAQESVNGLNAQQVVNSAEEMSVETPTQTAIDTVQMTMPAINKESISIELKPGQATEVTNTTTALTAAIAVDLINFLDEGNSISFGISALYII